MNGLDLAYQSATYISLPFRVVLMSDCHRGVGDWADDFAHNQFIYFCALKWYYTRGYTYIELGDGDELWENASIVDIYSAHSDIFWLLNEFAIDDRFHLILGNHNHKPYLHHLSSITDRDGCPLDLFAHSQRYTHNAMVLDNHILLIHGHQFDPISSHPSPLNWIPVRYLWRPLQMLGVRDPTRPATNISYRNSVEDKLRLWADTHCTVIAGHTHRPRFTPPYYNTGSCVHPRCITAIEIEDGQVALVKWALKAHEDGIVKVDREVLAS